LLAPDDKHTDLAHNISVLWRIVITNLNIVKKLLSQGNGMFTASLAVGAGLHRQNLADFVKSGILVRVERGLYISPDGLDDVLFWLQQLLYKYAKEFNIEKIVYRYLEVLV